MAGTRVNAAVPGVIVLGAALVAAFAASQSWVRLSSPRLGVGIDVGFDYLPGSDGASGEPLLLGLAAFGAVSGLLLLVTRWRWLLVIWRLLAVTCGLLMIGFAIYLWDVVSTDPGAIVAARGGKDLGELAGAASRLARAAGLFEVDAALGLWLLTISGALVLLGALIPGFRLASGFRQGRVPPGWYPVPGGSRYWDGHTWTDELIAGG